MQCQNLLQIVFILLFFSAERAFAGEKPILLQRFISSFSVVHDVDVADEGILGEVSNRNISDGFDRYFPTMHKVKHICKLGAVCHKVKGDTLLISLVNNLSDLYFGLFKPYSDMVALIHSKNHEANNGKTAGRYQFDTHPTELLSVELFNSL